MLIEVVDNGTSILVCKSWALLETERPFGLTVLWNRSERALLNASLQLCGLLEWVIERF